MEWIPAFAGMTVFGFPLEFTPHLMRGRNDKVGRDDNRMDSRWSLPRT